jgi:hypothetical protein
MTPSPSHELVAQFVTRVNDALDSGQFDVAPIYQAMLAQAATEDERAPLDEVYQNFREAAHPTEFTTRCIEGPGPDFETCYELLRQTFQPDVLSPRAGYVRHFVARERTTIAEQPVPLVMLGRFWRVSGLQRYDAAGRLVRFDHDSLAVTEHMASVISGQYMSLLTQLTQAGRGLAIAAVGHLATRAALRRGGGHGRALVAAFEREIAALAAARGETDCLIVLEAEHDAMTFWAKQGYRWPLGSRYAQPPLEFDPASGERLYDEAPELFMVKDPRHPAATSVPASLLRDTVQTLYDNWCLAQARTFAPHAATRAAEYVGKVYAAFDASLPPGDVAVPLIDPPQERPAWAPVE